MRNFKLNKKLLIRLLILVGIVGLFLVIFYFPSLPYRPPKVVSATPANGATDVSSSALIRINFDKAVPIEEQGNFYLRLLPGVAGTPEWLSPTQLTLITSQPLQPSTTYRLALSYSGEELFESQFTTRFRKVYTDEELTELKEFAFVTSEAMYEMQSEYPFLEDLPLTSDSFSVMFDSERNQFRYYLKMDAGVPEETKQEAIDAATRALQLIDVIVEDYGYYVVFSSELSF